MNKLTLILIFLVVLPVCFAQLDTNCTTDKNFYYSYERAKVTCHIENNYEETKDFKICYHGECSNFSLGQGQNEDIFLSLFPINDALLTFVSTGMSENVILNYQYYDVPQISLSNIKNPESMTFDSKENISFSVIPTMQENNQNVEVKLSINNHLKKIVKFDKLDETAYVSFQIKGSDLDSGKNDVELLVNYQDKNLRNYQTKQELSIDLLDLNLFQFTYHPHP